MRFMLIMLILMSMFLLLYMIVANIVVIFEAMILIKCNTLQLCLYNSAIPTHAIQQFYDNHHIHHHNVTLLQPIIQSVSIFVLSVIQQYFLMMRPPPPTYTGSSLSLSLVSIPIPLFNLPTSILLYCCWMVHDHVIVVLSIILLQVSLTIVIVG